MNLTTYQPYWDAVQPVMHSKMNLLATELRAYLPTCLKVTDPVIQTDTDEFKVSADIVADNGTVVIGMDFTLLDGDEQGCQGLGIALSLTGHNALVAGGYFPYAYTPEAYSFDTDELLNRVQELSLHSMVRHIIDVCLTDEVLLRELAESGVTI